MTARQHHYLSQFYLKGFTNGRAKKSKLVAIDLKEKKWFETIPRNVGGIRDFNRIEIQNTNPNALESSLAEFEAKAATALKKLEENLDFSGDNKATVLNLLALIAIRSPERREHMRKTEAQIVEVLMGTMLHSKERWESQVTKLIEENPESYLDIKNKVTYEEALKFYHDKNYTIKVAREHHIHMEMVQVDAILPCLFARNWMLVRSTDKTGPFITTDKPVSLTWDDPESIPQFFRASPGFALKGTQILFPVSQSLALIGKFEIENKTIEGTKELVALLNTTMLGNLYKQIYAPKIGFKFYGNDEVILNGNHILQEIGG